MFGGWPDSVGPLPEQIIYSIKTMAGEIIYPYALTTVQRVKDLLQIDNNAHDAVIARLINSVTDYIEAECNGRRFVQQTYTNETFSSYNPRQSYLILRNSPVYTLTKFQYRAGPVTSPNWTDFMPDQYELIDLRTDRAGNQYSDSGIVRVYGIIPRIMNNSIRATYVAGYPVDWENAGNQTHLLPADLTRTAENLVIRFWKRRDLAGQNSKSLEGSTTSWRNDLDAEDKDIIGHYMRVSMANI